jgi:NAD(P)-dependent dehydrogenase (short-subunit alcohol dehydrogenase family)
MPKTLAIVGAGPGLGLSLARRFADESFEIVLLSRDPTRLDFDARKVAADVTDRDGLASALASLGPIDVLEYSPAPMFGLVQPKDLTPENVLAPFEHQVLGAVAAVNAAQLRPGGALLFTTAASSITPVPMTANMGIAMAALRAYAKTLHLALAPDTFVGHLAIDMFMQGDDADTAASALYDLYAARTDFEVKVGNFLETLT